MNPSPVGMIPQLFHEDGSSVKRPPTYGTTEPSPASEHVQVAISNRHRFVIPSLLFCSRCISSPFCQSDSLPQLSVVKAATNTKLTGNQSKILTEWTAWLFHYGRDCFHPLWNHWTSFGAIAILLGNLSGHEGFALHRGDCSGLFPCILSKHWHPCTWSVHPLVGLVTVPI